MKINWGTGILIVIIIFLVAVFSFAIFTTTQKINLVEKDYYPRELDFDTQIEKNSNTESLSEKITFTKADSIVIITFPEFVDAAQVEGNILVYRPSDFEQDIKYRIDLDTNRIQYIPTNKLLPGKYIIKVDWAHKGINYFQEKVIIN